MIRIMLLDDNEKGYFSGRLDEYITKHGDTCFLTEDFINSLCDEDLKSLSRQINEVHPFLTEAFYGLSETHNSLCGDPYCCVEVKAKDNPNVMEITRLVLRLFHLEQDCNLRKISFMAPDRVHKELESYPFVEGMLSLEKIAKLILRVRQNRVRRLSFYKLGISTNIENIIRMFEVIDEQEEKALQLLEADNIATC